MVRESERKNTSIKRKTNENKHDRLIKTNTILITTHETSKQNFYLRTKVINSASEDKRERSPHSEGKYHIDSNRISNESKQTPFPRFVWSRKIKYLQLFKYLQYRFSICSTHVRQMNCVEFFFPRWTNHCLTFLS